MQSKYSLNAKVTNPFLYEKIDGILKKHDINPKEEGKDTTASIQLNGKGDTDIFRFGTDKEEIAGSELFPNNLYEVSPFLFLYLLRIKDYPLEVFYEIREFFYSNFREITDGYSEIKIDFDSFEPVVNANQEEGFEKKHKSLFFKDGKLLFSDYYNIQTEKNPTPARVISEKVSPKVEEDTKLYKNALDALRLDEGRDGYGK